MALSTATPAVSPDPRVVGQTFVKFYYDLLQNQRHSLCRMYEESSSLSLPDANGVMVSVTTTQAINDVLLSRDYFKGCEVNYETVDSQLSQNDGISILVTGYLIGLEMIKRKFCQTFFLASKRDGVRYFVLNDMFRFVDEVEPKQLKEDLKVAAVIVPEYEGGGTATQPSVGVPEHGEEAHCTSEMGDAVGEQMLSAVSASKTYASIVTGRTMPMPVYVTETETEKPLGVSTNPASEVGGHSVNQLTGRTMPMPDNVTEPEKPLGVSTNPASEVGISTNPASEVGVSTNPASEVVGHSVYVSSLPLNATVDLLATEFAKFGRIVPGGVQVKWNPIGSYCYGFVEFEEQMSMQDAINASPITVAGCRIYVDKKKTAVRVRNGVVIRPNHYPPVNGWSRNENFRGNGGFVRNLGSDRGNFSAPGRFQGFSPRDVQNRMQPRFFHNGDGRMGQQGYFQNDNRRMGQQGGFFQNDNRRMGQVRDLHNGDGMMGAPRNIYHYM